MRPTLAFLNLMPNKIETERQWLSIVQPDTNGFVWQPFITSSYQPKNTDLSLLIPRYTIGAPNTYDALVVTGAPLGRIPYNQVTYWQELCALFSHCIENNIPVFCSCWAANAYLYAQYELLPEIRTEKLFGVFEHKKRLAHPLLNDLDKGIWIPQSRYAFVSEEAVQQTPSLRVLLDVPEEGPALMQDQFDNVMLLAHPEYAADTLENEYQRDRKQGLATRPPIRRVPAAPAANSTLPEWQLNGRTIFRNWLLGITKCGI